MSLSFQLDGLSLLLAMLITGVGAIIFAYAPSYLARHPDRWRLYTWLMLFMISMLGLVLADNVIALFLFWELTSITSYMLIGFKHELSAARDAALQALLVTGLGGLSLLAGLLLLGHAGGSFELSELILQHETLRDHALLAPSLALILVGVFTKSAQFPFHFWLPNAMQAPTPVSAYLHSATMVKAGVYLAARISPLASGVAIWDYSLVAGGTATALVGGWLSLCQSDLKRMLAYSTVSTLGVLTLLLGLGSGLAVKAAILLLVAHSLYKATMFLIAGAVDHCVGTRDLMRLGGLARTMPMIALVACLAAISMAGLPPSGGFLAKELIYEALLDPTATWQAAAVLFANASFVSVACLVAVRPFFGSREATTPLVHSPSWGLAIPPLFLGLLGLTLGMFASDFGSFIVAPAAAAVHPEIGDVHLKLWHGFHLPLLLSVVTLATGIGLYILSSRLRQGVQIANRLSARGPNAWYEISLSCFKRFASWQTGVLQNGKLRSYLLVVLVTFTSFVAYQLIYRVEVPRGGEWLELQIHELFIPTLILSSAVMAVRATSRLAAVCALGAIGYAMAMLFVMYGAPDLAMTQFAIETLTVILFVFVLYRLPRFARLSTTRSRIRDACVSIVAGVVMGGVVLAATAAHAPSRLSQYYAENSLPAAKGKNIVNVILVDFRGLDTLGEITVLTVAALGIFTLIRIRTSRAAAEARSDEHLTDGDERNDGSLTRPPKVGAADIATEELT